MKKLDDFLKNLDEQLNEDAGKITKSQIIANAAAYKELYAKAFVKSMIKYLINTESEIWDDVMDDACDAIDSIQRKLKLSNDDVAYEILHEYFEYQLARKVRTFVIKVLRNIDFKNI